MHNIRTWTQDYYTENNKPPPEHHKPKHSKQTNTSHGTWLRIPPILTPTIRQYCFRNCHATMMDIWAYGFWLWPRLSARLCLNFCLFLWPQTWLYLIFNFACVCPLPAWPAICFIKTCIQPTFWFCSLTEFIYHLGDNHRLESCESFEAINSLSIWIAGCKPCKNIRIMHLQCMTCNINSLLIAHK